MKAIHETTVIFMANFNDQSSNRVMHGERSENQDRHSLTNRETHSYHVNGDRKPPLVQCLNSDIILLENTPNLPTVFIRIIARNNGTVIQS